MFLLKKLVRFPASGLGHPQNPRKTSGQNPHKNPRKKSVHKSVQTICQTIRAKSVQRIRVKNPGKNPWKNPQDSVQKIRAKSCQKIPAKMCFKHPSKKSGQKSVQNPWKIPCKTNPHKWFPRFCNKMCRVVLLQVGFDKTSPPPRKEEKAQKHCHSETLVCS